MKFCDLAKTATSPLINANWEPSKLVLKVYVINESINFDIMKKLLGMLCGTNRNSLFFLFKLLKFILNTNFVVLFDVEKLSKS